MAVRTAHDCDRCGAKDLQDWAPLRVKVGTFTDVPSGRTEDDLHSVDLCLPCCGTELKVMVRLMTPESATSWLRGLETVRRGK